MYLDVTIEAEEKLFAEARKSHDDDETKWFCNDGTDHWLYETGMIQYLGKNQVFYNTDADQFLVFLEEDYDAVNVVSAIEYPDLRPIDPEKLLKELKVDPDKIIKKITSCLRVMTDRGEWTEMVGSREWSFHVREDRIEAETYNKRRNKITRVTFKLSFEKVTEYDD